MSQPSITVQLTDTQASFLAFLAGHYVGLLHKEGLGVPDTTKQSAKKIADRIVGKFSKAATERARREAPRRLRDILRSIAKRRTP
jgi:hypothetical protein